MPNNVHNKLTITGPLLDRAELQQLMAGETPFDFNKILPMPEELLGIATGSVTINGIKCNRWRIINKENVPLSETDKTELIVKYGAADWYDWARSHWGTKWNACFVEAQETPFRLIYDFTTAWSSPKNVIDVLSTRFPRLKFKVSVSGEVDYPYVYEVETGENQ